MKNHVFIDSAVDCPVSMLGYLKPTDPAEEQHMQVMRGEQVVNGVTLSEQVVEELQRLGISLHWYSASQLQDAVLATHYDGQLIDDPNGLHFRDQLTLTNREKISDNLKHPFARMRVKTTRHGPHHNSHLPKKKKCDKDKKERGGLFSFF